MKCADGFLKLVHWHCGVEEVWDHLPFVGDYVLAVAQIRTMTLHPKHSFVEDIKHKS